MTLPTPAAIEDLKAALPGAWTQDADDMAPWLTEWRGRWTGEAPILLQPRTTEEVATGIAICARHGVAVVTQGGGTGLVGGQIPFGEVLLSTRKLRTVRDVTPLDDAMTLEAGVTLLEAQQLAKEKDRFFPLSLAAEGSATIGGVISTNAGGTAVLRYGMMRDLVLGIEAVMPGGQVFNGAIAALEVLKRPCRIDLHTDSKYVMQGITEWIKGWKARGWKTADKKPVKNDDLWRRLDEARSRHEVKWHWVKGHAGHVLNERADGLANRGVDDVRRR